MEIRVQCDQCKSTVTIMLARKDHAQIDQALSDLGWKLMDSKQFCSQMCAWIAWTQKAGSPSLRQTADCGCPIGAAGDIHHTAQCANGEIRNLEARVQRQLNELGRRVTSNREWIQRATSIQIDDNVRLHKLEGKLIGLVRRSERITSLEDAFDQSHAKLNSRVIAVEEILERLETHVTTLEEQMAYLHKNGDLTKRLEVLEEAHGLDKQNQA